MNIQEYISGGIIESYCLGLASPEEAAEFESYCLQYPELAAARDNFEKLLELQVFENTKEPDPSVKKALMSVIRKTGNETAPVIRMVKSGKGNTGGVIRWIAAASVILFIAAAALAISFYSKNANLTSTAKDLEAKLDSARQQVEGMGRQERIMSDPAVAVVNMTGTTAAPAASVNVYWDSASTDVYLVVKNLPAIPTDKQYQLWALINGQPKDLGLFEQSNRVILKMKNTQKADAFAITLEKRGNTGGPRGEIKASGKPR